MVILVTKNETYTEPTKQDHKIMNMIKLLPEDKQEIAFTEIQRLASKK